LYGQQPYRKRFLKMKKMLCMHYFLLSLLLIRIDCLYGGLFHNPFVFLKNQGLLKSESMKNERKYSLFRRKNTIFIQKWSNITLELTSSDHHPKTSLIEGFIGKEKEKIDRITHPRLTKPRHFTIPPPGRIPRIRKMGIPGG
jgi:hypothetical protein